jgi:hypothetical protein
VVWNIPCDPSNIPATINGIPRNEGEGLLCYIVRALNLTTPSGFVTVNGVQTLTNKTINNLIAIGTIALPAGSVTNIASSFNVYGGSSGPMNGYRLLFYASQGTASSPAIISGNTDYGSIYWHGYDGSSFIKTATIRAGTSTTPSANSIPSLLLFSTAGTSGEAIDRVVINSSGDLAPTTDNACTLGASGLRWASVWAANGTIQTSDERAKKEIEDAPLGLDFINALRPVAYKFKVGSNKVIRQVYRDADGNEVAANEEGSIPSEIITEEIAGQRVHYGLIAQEVKSALPEGVDFGGWILTDKNDPDSEQGLRYEEFISPLIKAVKELSEKNEALEARILALELNNL